MSRRPLGPGPSTAQSSCSQRPPSSPASGSKRAHVASEELETAYEETLLELEEKGGEGTLRPMLVEAQNRERAALDRVEELEKKLGELQSAK